jgi:hypothetical protein
MTDRHSTGKRFKSDTEHFAALEKPTDTETKIAQWDYSMIARWSTPFRLFVRPPSISHAGRLTFLTARSGGRYAVSRDRDLSLLGARRPCLGLTEGDSE